MKTKLFVVAISVLLSSLLAGMVIASSAHGMTFTVIDNPCGDGNASWCGSRIYGSGMVEPSDAQRLRAFVRQKGNFTWVTLSSPGGSLYGGLLLGQEIRSLRLNTSAERSLESWSPGTKGGWVAEPVNQRISCYSACAYAFLGGVERNVVEGAVLGFHQFKSVEPTAGAEQSAQVNMTLLRQYLQQMGVDEEVLAIASMTPANSITVVSAKQARALRIDNTEPLTKPWTITALTDGTPALLTTTYLPDGRELKIGMLQKGDTVLARISLLVPRDLVAPERLASFPENQNTKVTLGGIPARALNSWKKQVTAGGMTVFDIDVAFAPDLLHRAASSQDEIILNDGYSGRALSDVGLWDVPISRDGLANGLRLIGRTR